MSITEEKRKEIDHKLKQYGINHGFVVLDEYINAKTHIKCECIKHHHVFYKTSNNLMRSKGCPVCINNEWTARMNKRLDCVWDTHPDIAKHLKNAQDGYMYSHGSGKEFIFICPICGNEILSTMNYATTRGLICKVCSNGKSYPNKIMYNLLTQLDIDFISEYSDDWTNGKIYDFYFCANGQKYIIEMDGAFHYNTALSSYTLQKDIDDYKDSLAEQQNICLIRIDCNYPDVNHRFEYIRNNILNSKLSSIFDLSIINFNDCDYYANLPVTIILSNAWNNGIRTLEDLSKLIGYNKDATSILLKRASDFKLITESRDNIHTILCNNGYKISREKQIFIKLSSGKPVRIIQTNEIFSSPAEAKRRYPELKGIYDNLYGKIHYAGEINGQKISVEYLST